MYRSIIILFISILILALVSPNNIKMHKSTESESDECKYDSIHITYYYKQHTCHETLRYETICIRK